MVAIVIILVAVVCLLVTTDLRRFRSWWNDVNLLYESADSVDDLLDLRAYVVSSASKFVKYRWQGRLVRNLIDKIDRGLVRLSKSLFLFLLLLGGGAAAQGRIKSWGEDEYSLVQGRYHTVSYRIRAGDIEDRIIHSNKDRGLGFLCVSNKKFMVTNEEYGAGFEVGLTYVKYDGEYSLVIMGSTYVDGERCWLTGTVSPVSATIELRGKNHTEIIKFYSIALHFDKEACRRAHRAYHKQM